MKFPPDTTETGNFLCIYLFLRSESGFLCWKLLGNFLIEQLKSFQFPVLREETRKLLETSRKQS